MIRRSFRALAAVAFVLVPLAAALAGDDASEPVRRAARDLIHGDLAARAAAVATLTANPTDAVPELLRLVDELRAAGAAAGGQVDRVSVPPPSGVSSARPSDAVVQIYDVRDLVRGRVTLAILEARLEGVDGVEATPHGDGLLVVVAPRAGHAELQGVLGTMRERALPAVAIGSYVIRSPAAAALGADLSGLRPGGVMPLDDVAQRLARWQSAGDAEVVSGPVVTTLGDAPASLTAGREVSYVEDMDVTVAQGTLIADPIVSTIFDGLVAEFRAYPAESGIRIAVDATVTDLGGEFDVVTTDLDALPEPVRIQRPSFVRTQVERLVTVADGGSFVIRLPDEQDGTRRLLLVTARREAGPLDDD